MKYNHILNLFILSFFLLTSCNESKKEEIKEKKSKTIKYATGFDIVKSNNKTKLIVKMPYPGATDSFEYILSNTKTSTANSIKTPVESVVVTSTTHIPMLELLNIEDKLVGFPNSDYVSSKKTRALIKNGKVQELGNEENINTEVLLDLHPELVIGFSLNSNNKMFNTIEKMGIPVVINGDWLEETPLGRAEWIKFFGVLFDKEKEADSIFKTIENNYLSAKKIATKATLKPTLLSGGLFKDVWNLPAGESYEATFLKDANTNYLWKDSKGKGSLALNIENVFEKGKNAEIWVSPSYYGSLSQLEKANDIYPKFKAFINSNIYSFVNKRGEKGGISYYELSPARPDLVLKDLIKIAHPELLEDYDFTFFEKLK